MTALEQLKLSNTITSRILDELTPAERERWQWQILQLGVLFLSCDLSTTRYSIVSEEEHLELVVGNFVDAIRKECA